MDKDVLLYNTTEQHRFPSDFLGQYHIHILCLKGKMQFAYANQTFQLKENKFAIWQLGSEITDVLYSPDFEAEFLLIGRQFLMEYNPETLWATKAYVYIKSNPIFHLGTQEKKLIEADFRTFRLLSCLLLDQRLCYARNRKDAEDHRHDYPRNSRCHAFL